MVLEILLNKHEGQPFRKHRIGGVAGEGSQFTFSRRRFDMKKWILPLAVLVVFSAVAATPAAAGEKSRHRWQGIAIGVASTVLLDHLVHHPHVSAPVAHGARPYAYRYDRYDRHDRYDDGYRYRDGYREGYRDSRKDARRYWRHKQKHLYRPGYGYGRHYGPRYGYGCR